MRPAGPGISSAWSAPAGVAGDSLMRP
jgi:hypothetical protein